ncbi:trichohyalin-like [Trichomycterus rosablanca]|uniref:trichohyalin-like n=1 Tax=Trichomycterus rosablanca TaxID=2290929 RepID=UPI002F35A3B2
MLEDKERQRATKKDSQQEIFPSAKWPEPLQRTHKSTIERLKSSSREEDNAIFTEKSEVDMFFPLKPVCHRRAFNLNNCQSDISGGVQKDRKRLEYHFCSTSQSKQPYEMRQEKNYQGKLQPFDTETTGTLFNRHQTLHEDQQRLQENQKRLTKEIRIREIVLHEKLVKAEQQLRKVQLRTLSEDRLKREEMHKSMHTGKAESRLYYNEKVNWNWERTRELALKGQRDGHNEKSRDRVRGNKNSPEILESCPREMNLYKKEKSREGREWVNRGRNTEVTTNYKTQERKQSSDEEITRQKLEMSRTEKDKIRRERSVNWEIKEPNQRGWKMEILNDREKRRGEQAMARTNIETDDGEKRWNILDKLKSNLNGKSKAPLRHDQMNGIAADQWPTLERLHQSRIKAVVETTNNKLPTESLTEVTPHTPPTNQKGKRLQQVELSPERSPDADGLLVPCGLCHRRFAEDRLERHSRVCKKMQLSTRKVFDSSKYRAKGTDLEEFTKANGRSKTPELKKNNWRQKHEALIRNMRQARAPVPGRFQPQTNADLNPDYITCPYCGRRFAPGPAERHIPKCQNIKSRPPPLKHR